MIPHIPSTATGAEGNVADWIRKAATSVNLLIGTKLEWVAAPATANAAGRPGQVAYEDGFFYACIATDEWQRVAIATW